MRDRDHQKQSLRVRISQREVTASDCRVVTKQSSDDPRIQIFWADSLLGRQYYHIHLTDEKDEARRGKNPEPKCWAGESQERAWRCLNSAWNCWCAPHPSLLWLDNQRLVPPIIWKLPCHWGRKTFRDGEVLRTRWIHFLQISGDINLIYTGSIFLFH